MTEETMAKDQTAKGELLFVYNADSSFFSQVSDLIKKVAAPKSYPCNLCKVTYGVLGIRKDWKLFIGSLPYRLTFYHRDEFRRSFPEHRVLPLPAVLLRNRRDAKTSVILDSKQINRVSDVKSLKKALAAKIAVDGEDTPTVA
jgi:hypothetical protein